jgi:hypothetical protein
MGQAGVAAQWLLDETGSYAGSRLSTTESNSGALKRAQRAGFALRRTTLFGLWSRRPRVRVPSLTLVPCKCRFSVQRFNGTGLRRGPDTCLGWNAELLAQSRIWRRTAAGTLGYRGPRGGCATGRRSSYAPRRATPAPARSEPHSGASPSRRIRSLSHTTAAGTSRACHRRRHAQRLARWGRVGLGSSDGVLARGHAGSVC